MRSKHKPELLETPRRTRRLGWVAFFSLLVVLAGLVLFGWNYVQGPFAAPQWVLKRVDAGLERAFPDHTVYYDNLELMLDSDGRPRVTMRDVVVRDDAGRQVLEFFNLSSALSLAGVFEGVVQPKRLELSGVFLSLTRDEDGDIGLGIGAGVTVAGAGALDGLEAILAQPFAEALELVQVDNVTLRYVDRRALRSWTVDGGRMRMSVDEGKIAFNGDLALLSGRASVATLEANADVNRAEGALEFGVAFSDMPANDLATQSAALAWLGILDAPISGALRGGIDAAGQFLPVSASLQIGAGALQPSEGARGIQFRSAGTYFTYRPATQELQFDEVALDSDLLSGRASGTTRMTMADNGLPNQISGRFRMSQLQGTPGEVWRSNVSLDQAAMAFDMQLRPFHFELIEASIEKGDEVLLLSGAVDAQDAGWALALRGEIAELSHQSLVGLWPPTALPSTRKWLVENIKNARYSGLKLALDSDAGAAAVLTLTSDFREARIRYAPNMSPVLDVAGQLRIAEGGLFVTASEGSIEPITGEGINAAGTGFSIPVLKGPDARGVVDLRGTGPLEAFMALLEEIPGLANDQTDLRELGVGRAEMQGQLSFPVGRKPTKEEYAYDIQAEVRDVRSQSLLRDMDLSSEVLHVTARPEGVTVTGPARVGNVLAEVKWSSIKGDEDTAAGSRVTGQVELSQAFAQEFRLGLPEGTVTGRAIGELELSMPRDETPVFELQSDLKGLGLGLPFINWSKPPESAGALVVKGAFSEPVDVQTLQINAAGFIGTGRVSMRPDGGLDALTFQRLRIEDWLDAPVKVVGRGIGKAPDIVIDGGRVDLTKMRDGAQSSNAGSSGVTTEGRLVASLDSLVVSKGIELTEMKGDFALQGLNGRFRGRLNDKVEVVGAVASAPGGKQITLSSDDAGKVFAALGVLQKADYGDIWVELIETEKGYRGQFRAANVVLREMPALAQLLNAVSIVGLLEQMAYDGIVFAEIEGEFFFSDKTFILSRASATGPSTGLSLDGTYDLERGTLDMQGVLSPAYLVNSLGGLFNRKGEGLFGISFGVSGDAKAPRISVNPLSALTPGIFRDIFRKAAPEVPE